MHGWTSVRRKPCKNAAFGQARPKPFPASISGYYNSLLGWFHLEQGEFESARAKLERAADLLESAGRNQKLPAVYNNLAPCLTRLGDYGAAEHCLRAAIHLNSAKKDERKLAINYHNLGRNYNAQEQSEKAIACFERSAALQGEKDADYYEGMTKAFFNRKDLRKRAGLCAKTASNDAGRRGRSRTGPAMAGSDRCRQRKTATGHRILSARPGFLEGAGGYGALRFWENGPIPRRRPIGLPKTAAGAERLSTGAERFYSRL